MTCYGLRHCKRYSQNSHLVYLQSDTQRIKSAPKTVLLSKTDSQLRGVKDRKSWTN